MASSASAPGSNANTQNNPSSASTEAPQRPTEHLSNTQSTSNNVPTGQGDQAATTRRRKNHRAGKKKKNRRQSFATPGDEAGLADPARSNHDLLDAPNAATARSPFYRLGQSGGRHLSDTSLDSQALLDHRWGDSSPARSALKLTSSPLYRDHPPMRARRDSRLSQGAFGPRPRQSSHEGTSPYRPSYSNPFLSHDGQHRRPRPSRAHASSGGNSENDDVITNDRTPLLPSINRDRPASGPDTHYGMFGFPGRDDRHGSRNRRSSAATSTSSKRRRHIPTRELSSGPQQDYDVNNPPSVPNSPKLGSDMNYDDVLVTGSIAPSWPAEDRRATIAAVGDQLINIDGDEGPSQHFGNSSPSTPKREALDQRRRTVALLAEEDVCFPLEGMSEMAEEDFIPQGENGNYQNGQRRRRGRQWPDLSVLDEWSREEKEERSEGIRAKKISEPVLVGGRLRPQKHGWHRTEEDAPYRFTYFNEEFQSTIHSQTISELLQPGQSFRDLFIPDPPELSDDSSDEEDDLISHQDTVNDKQVFSPNGRSRAGTRQSSVVGDPKSGSGDPSGDHSGDATPQGQLPKEKQKRYGARPTFWLDVLSPTDTEMRVISKTFGIHPLTAEDIMMQEAREKVELFRNYYFVNYRTFEQDMNSEDFLEPVNMYVVVFREGVISFHFSMTPHPANVRRRIRQLKDYLILSSDWISYAIIDDITDVFAPLIQSIEDEVDDIDDAILQLHVVDKPETKDEKSKVGEDNEKKSDAGDPPTGGSGGDMLRRVGEGRKKVMGLYRLLGNKADVIKGFAKRCNEQWEIAPRSEIGLYLGDIQDHILTMTSNLSHYETYVRS